MATIAAQCPKCGRKGNVPEQALGRQVKCPGCANMFTVAAANGPPGGGSPKPTSGSHPGQPKPTSGSHPGEPRPTSGSHPGQKPAPWFSQKDGSAASSAPSAPSSPDGLILAQCPCGFSGRVPDRYQGKQVKCRQCGQMFTVGGMAEKPAAETKPSGPAAKLRDAPAGTDASSPMEEESIEVECEVIEDVEVVGDSTCPVCGNKVKLPGKGKKLRCPKCCTVFNVDGTTDDGTEEEEEPTPQEMEDSHPEKEAAAEDKEPAAAAPSAWANLDQPASRKTQPRKKPVAAEDDDEETPRRPAFKAKQRSNQVEEEARRRSVILLICVVGGALFLLAGGLALVAGLMNDDRAEKARNVAQVRNEPAVPQTPPPQTRTPPPVVRPTQPQQADPPPRKTDPPPEPPPDKRDPAPKEGDWVDVSIDSYRDNNIRLKVNAVWVDDVKQFLRGQKVGAIEDVLVIQYEIDNTGAQGALNFTGWGAQKAQPGPTAVLTDNNGRVYERLVLEAVENQLAAAKLLDPAKRAEDRLLFAAPDSRADFFRLELPAKNFGGTGTIRLQIPRSIIDRKVVRKEPSKEDIKKLTALRLQLKSAKPAERIRACNGIGSLRDDGAPAVPDLIKLYGADKNEGVREAVCEAIAFIGPPAKEAVPTLIRALKDKNEFWRVQREAAKGLSVIGASAEQAKQAIPLLQQLLKSTDEGVADAARAALRRLDPKGN